MELEWELEREKRIIHIVYVPPMTGLRQSARTVCSYGHRGKGEAQSASQIRLEQTIQVREESHSVCHILVTCIPTRQTTTHKYQEIGCACLCPFQSVQMLCLLRNVNCVPVHVVACVYIKHV